MLLVLSKGNSDVRGQNRPARRCGGAPKLNIRSHRNPHIVGQSPVGAADHGETTGQTEMEWEEALLGATGSSSHETPVRHDRMGLGGFGFSNGRNFSLYPFSRTASTMQRQVSPAPIRLHASSAVNTRRKRLDRALERRPLFGQRRDGRTAGRTGAVLCCGPAGASKSRAG
jgi:hypothetical protein